jgi:outer membrane lipoprotein SlyB
MTRSSLARLAAPLVLVLTLAGCALNPSIADIKYNPGRYQDRTVAVEGTVTSSWGVPLVPFKLYKVDDGTGEMTVVANNGRTPSKGSRVRVKGRVSDVAMFGGQSLGLHMEQKDIDFKGR